MTRKNKKIKNHVYVGKVDHVNQQYAFIVVDDLPKDILVPYLYLRGAMHQDIVQVVMTTQFPKPEGRIIRIIKRTNPTLVGRIDVEDKKVIFIADNRKIHYAIKVKPNKKLTWRNNEKALLSITTYPTVYQEGEGEVIQLLGLSGSHQAETRSIIAQFQLEEAFNKDIEQEVAQLPAKPSSEEIARRRDFRSITTITIDPADAKDFDDALSLEKLDNGDYEVGIHIADVTHYVKEGTPLDQEALKRGTSVYLVGNTVSMLPERLANDLCSLRPHEDRLAFSVVVKLDQDANIKNVWIGETIIHSDHRFTYDEAHTILKEQEGAYYQELLILDQLAKKMRLRRIKAGAICFETTTPAITLDQEGNPIDIKPKSSHTTHQLIEEYALLANRLVAKTVWQKKEKKKHLPFIYRIHDQPDHQKVLEFAQLIRQLGYQFDTKPSKLPASYNKILTETKNTPHQTLIQIRSIQTMSQACYTTTPRGHFGLGFQYYTHFTSPIRRYPDIITHRLLKQYLKEGGGNILLRQNYEEIARHASIRERVATEAERVSIQGKQVVFMKKLEGETHEGVISGITEWGIYVELKKYKCEGMVRIADIPDDYYSFDPKHFSMKGKRKGKVYRIGNDLQVKIKKVSIEKKMVDMEIST